MPVPVMIAEYMFVEKVFTLKQLERIKESKRNEKEVLLTSLESVIREKSYNLKIFATALVMREGTNAIGKALLEQYGT